VQFGTLWDLTKGQRSRYLGAIVAMGVSYAFLCAVPLVVGRAVDRTLAGGAATTLWVDAAWVVALTAAGCVFVYLRLRWAAVASEAIARAIRDHVYGHLENLPASYHDRADTGDLVQRCTSDVGTVRVFLSQQVIDISRGVLLLLIIVPIMFWLDVRLALVSLALFPPIVVFAAIFFRRVKTVFQLVDEAEGAMTSVLQENLTGIRVVRAFARQEFECEKFDERNRGHRDLHFRLFRLLGNYWATSDILCMGQQGAVLIAGGYWMLAGAVSVGTLYQFMTYVGLLIWPVRHLGRVLQDTGKAIVSLRRLKEILAVSEESGGGEAPAGPLTGAIEVERLSQEQKRISSDNARQAEREAAARLAEEETARMAAAPAVASPSGQSAPGPEQEGDELAAQGDSKGAAIAYWKAVGQDDSRSDLWLKLTNAYRALREWPEAEACVLEARRRDRQNPDIEIVYLDIIRQTRPYDQFLDEIESSRSRYPQDPDIAILLANALSATGQDTIQAIRAYEDFLLLAPPDDPRRQQAKNSLNRIRGW